MIVGIQGSRNFEDYAIFLRAMGTALSMLPEDDNEFLIFSCGPVKINAFAMEFSNITERSLKARGKKIKLIKVPPSWFSNNMKDVNYFIYLGKPKETVSPIVKLAEAKDVEVGIYRY
jgi:hypothetical protein